MLEPSELDLAELKFEMRRLYQAHGFAGALQVLYEILIGAQMLVEVIIEESEKESK